MRVISGVAKGLKLKAPKVRDLRPTQDLVRKAIFDILGDFVKDKKVLDLYAGSGSLGIEALSNGAEYCFFVESNRNACATINQNLKSTKLNFKGRVVCRSVTRFLRELPNKDVGLVMLDPPYTLGKIEPILRKITPHLKEGGLIVYEHAKTTNVPSLEELRIIDRRIYGGTKVTFLAKKKAINQEE
jgi:16S rRNA (guanine(966)-N(2))-methyltransferase RsmD